MLVKFIWHDIATGPTLEAEIPRTVKHIVLIALR